MNLKLETIPTGKSTRALGLNVAIGLFTTALIAASWILTLTQIRHERTAAVEREFAQNANLALGFDELTQRVLNNAASTLRLIEREYRRQDTRLDIQKLIDDGLIDTNTLSFTGVIDTHGRLVLGAPEFKAIDTADRDYYQFHQTHDATDIYIGKPILGRVRDKWIVPLTRRINRADGSFGGIAFASLDTAYFARLFEHADLGELGLAMLVGVDGIARVRRSGQTITNGQDMRERTLMTELRKAAVGNFSSTGNNEGVPRYVSYRKLSHYPLIVAIGTSQAETLAPIKARARNYRVAAALASALFVLCGGGLIFALSRQRRGIEAIHASNSRFGVAFNQAAVGVTIAGLDGRFLEVNAAFCRMLGYSKDELLERRFLDITHPDDRDISVNNARRMLGEYGESPLLEKRYVRKDGGTVWVAIAVSVIRDGAGEPQNYMALAQDITEHKRAELVLADSERRFRTLVENSLDLILILDRQGVFKYVSPSIKRLHGYGAADLVGRNILEFAHSDDATALGAIVAEIAAKPRRLREATYRFRRKNGTWIVLQGIGTNLLDDPMIEGILINARDVTEQQRARKEIEFKNTVLATQQDNSPDGILLVDEHAKIVSYNRRFVEIWNVTEVMVKAGDDAPVLQHALAQIANADAFLARVAYLYEHTHEKSHEEIVLKDGRTIDRISAPVTAADGRYFGRVWYFRDITERKRAERLQQLEYLVASSLADAGGDSTALKAVIRSICETLGWECGRYLRVDEKAGVLRASEFWHVPDDAIEQFIAAKSQVVLGPGVGLAGCAWQSGQATWIADIRDDARALDAATALETGMRGAFHFPVMSEGKTIGVLAFNSRNVSEPDDRLLQVVNMIGSQIGQFLARMEQREHIARLNRIYAVLSGINSLIVHVHDRQALFDGACRIAVEQGQFGIAWIGVPDQKTLDVKPVAWAGVDSEVLTLGTVTMRDDVPEGQGAVGCAMREKRTAIIHDFAAAQWEGGEPRKEAIRRGYRSLAAFPLLVNDSAAGTLTLFAKEPNFFADDELKLLNELASDISFALEHIDKEDKIARLSRVQTVTSEINSLIVRVRDRQRLFDEVCRVAVEHGNFGAAWIGAFNSATLKVSPVAWAGHAAENLARTLTIWSTDVVNGTGVVSRAIREKRPVFENDITADAEGGSPARAEAVRAGFHSLMAVPFVIEDAVAGHLSLCAREAGFFNQDEVRLLSELGNNISFAAESIAWREKLEKVNRALKALSACNNILIRAANEMTLVQKMCDNIVEIGGYLLAWVGVVERDAEKTVHPVAYAGYEQGFMEKAEITYADNEQGHGPVGTAIRRKKIQVVQNVLNDPDFRPWRENAAKLGYGSLVALPLISFEEVIGVLTIYAAGTDAFNDAEMKLLAELADDLAFGMVTLRTRVAQEESEKRLLRSMEGTILAMAATLEMRDAYTAGHQRRVAELAVAIAREMGMPEDDIHGLHLAAVIHDLGKIQIPAEILSKPTRLSRIEYELIKTHPEAGYNILKGVDFPWPIAQIVYQHHERLDGTGYPQELKGEEILIGARILGVADTVEAMASHRPYRAGLGIDKALEEIIKNRDTIYDAAVVDACVRLFCEKRFSFQS